MRLNKMEDLKENQAFYEIFAKGIVEHKDKYSLRIQYADDYESSYYNISEIKEIKFYQKYMIFHLNIGHSILFRYDDFKEFKLYLY